MEINITKEQKESIIKATPYAEFEAELLKYVNGLVTFYVDKGEKAALSEEAERDSKRLALLKDDKDLLALLDASIEAEELVKEESAKEVEDGISVDTQVNNIKIQGQGWVKCDTNGDIYFDHRGSGASALTADIKIIGVQV